jgi:hypothetical protein
MAMNLKARIADLLSLGEKRQDENDNGTMRASVLAQFEWAMDVLDMSRNEKESLLRLNDMGKIMSKLVEKENAFNGRLEFAVNTFIDTLDIPKAKKEKRRIVSKEYIYQDTNGQMELDEIVRLLKRYE